MYQLVYRAPLPIVYLSIVSSGLVFVFVFYINKTTRAIRDEWKITFRRSNSSLWPCPCWCLCPFCIYTTMVHVQVHGSCACHVHGAYQSPWCMSISMVHVRVHGACPCSCHDARLRPCCTSVTMLQDHVHVKRPCVMSILHVSVHSACSCPGCMTVSMLHVHVHAACPCPCCMSMSIAVVHVYSVCLCTCIMDLDKQQGLGYSAWTWTWTIGCQLIATAYIVIVYVMTFFLIEPSSMKADLPIFAPSRPQFRYVSCYGLFINLLCPQLEIFIFAWTILCDHIVQASI